MTAELFEGTLSQADHALWIPRAAIAGYPPAMSINDSQEEWQMRLRSLQEWICQLLIKNQQLRMALMEVKAKEARCVDEDCA